MRSRFSSRYLILTFLIVIWQPTVGARAMDLVQVTKEIEGEIVQIITPLANNQTSLGSGFWIDERGYVATCWHVISANPTGTFTVQSAVDPLFDLKHRNIIAANWSAFRAKLVAKDEANDVAILKVESSPFGHPQSSPIRIGDATLSAHYKISNLETEMPSPGESILLAGYPLGRPYPIVQNGTVASIAYDLPEFGPTVKILISTVANPGNSGGPVIDSKNRVVGVLEGGLPSRQGLDPAQAQSGIAVAVPSHFVSALMNSIKP